MQLSHSGVFLLIALVHAAEEQSGVALFDVHRSANAACLLQLARVGAHRLPRVDTVHACAAPAPPGRGGGLQGRDTDADEEDEDEEDEEEGFCARSCSYVDRANVVSLSLVELHVW